MQDQTDWRSNLIDDDDGVREILEQAKTIAVVGIKDRPGQPAFYVPNYLSGAGYEIIPVSPNVERVFERDAYDVITEVPGDIDIMQIFRRPEFVRAHAEEALQKRPKVFWTQSGIVDWGSAELLAKSGIKVVMDRCMMVDHQRLLRSRA
ncbi:MAG TPA: CoA-binding protein [Blastocatellia bacterium]|nr:CoA-binding protein [Blastocatellia bacterium]